MSRGRRAVAAAALLLFGELFAAPAEAQVGTEGPAKAPPRDREIPAVGQEPIATETRPVDPSLIQGGSLTPTPVIDGDIENVPNLTDLELAAARLTISAQRAQTNLSVAPLLIPGRYTPVASEARIGVSADSDGAFGLGLAIGLNEPRMRLSSYAKDPSLCEPPAPTTDGLLAALDAEIEETLGDLCGVVVIACDRATDAPCKEAVKECAASAAPSKSGPSVPVVLRLVKVIRRVELLKEMGSPPSPPRPPDRAIKDDDYLAALTAYIGEATAFQGRRAAFTSARLLLPAARERRERREKAGERAILQREERLVGQRQICRLEAAYHRSSLVTLGGSVSFFPLYLGPSIEESDKAGSARVANAHYLRRVDATVGYRFYANRRASAQIRGGFRAERGDASEESLLLWRGLLGADLGFFVPVKSTLDADGFQRGLGFGLSATGWVCGSGGGCVTDVGRSSPYSATGLLPLLRRAQVTGFLEWRQAVALQIRAGVEARIDTVVGPITLNGVTRASPILTRIIPTLGLGSSFWGI